MKVALVYTSGFKKLLAHDGATDAYQEAEKAGRVPRPYFMTGASAGAIISAALSPWNIENSRRIKKALLGLKTSEIYSISHLTELLGVLTLGESFLNFIPPLQHDFMKSRRGQILIETGRTGISLASKIGFFWELLKQPSIFSSEPLRRLLKRELDCEAIWNSDVKLEIPAVDLQTAQMVYFTNYREEHRRHPKRDEVLVDMTQASASVTAFLPPIQIGNNLLDDAATLNSTPIDRAMAMGCDVIFVLMHRPYLETIEIRNKKMTWVEELNRAMDIAIGRNTELTLNRHQEVSQDLEIIETLEQMTDEIPQSPELLQRSHLMKFMLKKLSAYGLSKTKIIPVLCDEPLPNLTFNKFDPESLKKGYELGYRAMKRTLEKWTN
mgnify:CR=1 FL=1